MLKKLLSVLLLSSVVSNLISQTLIPMTTTGNFAVSQISGIPFRETLANMDAKGTPFLFENWQNGKVTLSNGNIYDSVKLKFNALDGKFYFNRNDTVYELPDDLAEVRLINIHDSINMDFKKIIRTDGKKYFSSFVEVLCNGKTPLYKEYLKRIEGENFTNGIVVSEKKIIAHNSLWTIMNNETVPVRLNKHSLDELTSDKIDLINDYVKKNKLNIKDEKRFVQALIYYNAIVVNK